MRRLLLSRMQNMLGIVKFRNNTASPPSSCTISAIIIRSSHSISMLCSFHFISCAFDAPSIIIIQRLPAISYVLSGKPFLLHHPPLSSSGSVYISSAH